MNAHAQFNAYMPSLASDAARAYLTGRAFPALDQLSRRARWARNANMLLTAVAALIALIIPILLLLPYSLPVEVMNLVVSGLSIVVVGILFAIVLLRLPVYAAENRLRARQLTTLLSPTSCTQTNSPHWTTKRACCACAPRSSSC